MNEKVIWNALMVDIANPYGVAGLMGNLFAESSLDPLCMTPKKSYTGEEYIKKVKQEDFSKDGIAFGIAQWRYWSRKEQLYLFAKEQKQSLGSIDLQLKFLLKEIKTYKTVWKTLLNAKSVQEASDIVLERYEKPANVSDKVKAKRASFGQNYYATFTTSSTTSDPPKKMVITTADNVNYRSGNSKSYPCLGQSKTKGASYEWIATAENGWHAIVATVNHKKQVVWMSGEFSKIM